MENGERRTENGVARGGEAVDHSAELERTVEGYAVVVLGIVAEVGGARTLVMVDDSHHAAIGAI